VSAQDVQAVELVAEGWVFGVLTCLLYAAIADYVEVKRRIRSGRRPSLPTKEPKPAQEKQ
jgi:hypothetical protein